MGISFTHLAFSDDSGHEDGRYNSLGLITLPASYEESLGSELKMIFLESGITKEFKWNYVDSEKYRFAAEKLHSFIFRHLDKIRIDVLIWDKHDSRHKNIFKRDNNANIGRMYYHLIRDVLGKRWSGDSTWFWRPDKQSSMDWQTLGNCLVSKKYEVATNLFEIDEDRFINLKLKLIKVVDSCREVFVQVADYFAGLGAYSYGHFNKYKEWEIIQAPQMSLFENAEIKRSWSNSERVRFPLINCFNEDCKKRSLTIALNSTKGFQTHNPLKPINFWLYRPQHALDKAPTFTNNLPSQ